MSIIGNGILLGSFGGCQGAPVTYNFSYTDGEDRWALGSPQAAELWNILNDIDYNGHSMNENKFLICRVSLTIGMYGETPLYDVYDVYLTPSFNSGYCFCLGGFFEGWSNSFDFTRYIPLSMEIYEENNVLFTNGVNVESVFDENGEDISYSIQLSIDGVSILLMED